MAGSFTFICCCEESLLIGEICVTYCARTARAVGGRTIEVLLILENIFLEGLQTSGPLQEGIDKFVAARRLTDRPVTVSRWDRDSK